MTVLLDKSMLVNFQFHFAEAHSIESNVITVIRAIHVEEIK